MLTFGQTHPSWFEQYYPSSSNYPTSLLKIHVPWHTWTLTFDFQDQIRGGGVADEALRGDAPEVDLVVRLWGETHAASCHRHAAAGTQAALLQQLEARGEERIISSVTFRLAGSASV